MHDTVRSKTKGTNQVREPGGEIQGLLRDVLALVAGTKAVSREREHHHLFHHTPRHRLARSAGHLAGYTLLGYIIVHQRRRLKDLAD